MKIVEKRNTIIICGIAIGLLIIGSLFDFEISNLLYSPESILGTFFAAFGEYAGMVCTWAGAACMFASLDKTKPLKKVLLIIVTVLALLFSLFGLIEPYQFLDGALRYVGVVLEIVISIVVFVIILKKVDRSDPVLLRKIAAILLLVNVLGVLLANIVKIPWGRPRYRSIIITEGLNYQPWWVTGTALKSAFEGILPHEEFKSFPSGHSVAAASSLALILLSKVLPSVKEKTLTICVLLWTICVMVFRIVAGAHFLTDVVIGFSITYVLVLIFCKGCRINDGAKKVNS